ncbi:actin-related protein 10-like [Littorina saxatilis]|uniref:Actin-related protein 10 n=1 Tax=Littorina saxatilis TaxID=31220 RepID=A0AAN9GDE0_9CAEN
MSLFEGLGYSNDKNVYIIDIGSAYTKCGLAGETGPRCIIPSTVTNSRTGKVTKIWDYRSTAELHENLKELLSVLIFRYLLMSPKDKRVVVVESLLCPTDFRECVARVLFRHFEVGCVLFAPGHVLSLLTLGSACGMVMDVGYNETLVVPVYEGIPIMLAWQSIPLGGKAIHSRIKDQLLDGGVVKTSQHQDIPVASVPDSLTEDILEDIKVRCCFVTEFSRGQAIQDVVLRGADASKMPTPTPAIDYPLDGSRIVTVSGKIREQSCEALFELDDDERSVAALLLDSLMQCPIDTRRELSENIVVVGGTAMLPGFFHRLKKELDTLAAMPRYKQTLGVKTFKFLKPPAKENYTAWLGGAMVGALETLPSKSLSRDAYLQRGRLPDWCSLDQETWIDDRTVQRR